VERKVPIRFLLFEHKDGWSAQCLEYGFATQAETLSDLYYEIESVIVGHITVSARLGSRPFEEFGRAPQKYWDMFDRAPLKLELPREIRIKVFEKLQDEVPATELRIAEPGPEATA
jgi:hypothetical protein